MAGRSGDPIAGLIAGPAAHRAGLGRGLAEIVHLADLDLARADLDLARADPDLGRADPDPAGADPELTRADPDPAGADPELTPPNLSPDPAQPASGSIIAGKALPPTGADPMAAPARPLTGPAPGRALPPSSHPAPNPGRGAAAWVAGPQVIHPDLVPLALVVCRPSGEALLVNAHWRALAGLDLDSSLGQGWLSAVSPAGRRTLLAALAGGGGPPGPPTTGRAEVAGTAVRWAAESGAGLAAIAFLPEAGDRRRPDAGPHPPAAGAWRAELAELAGLVDQTERLVDTLERAVLLGPAHPPAARAGPPAGPTAAPGAVTPSRPAQWRDSPA
jgi:hypothetical protein